MGWSIPLNQICSIKDSYQAGTLLRMPVKNRKYKCGSFLLDEVSPAYFEVICSRIISRYNASCSSIFPHLKKRGEREMKKIGIAIGRNHFSSKVQIKNFICISLDAPARHAVKSKSGQVAADGCA